MKQVVLLLLFLSSFAASASAQATALSAAPPKIEVAYTQFSLPNGLRVILHEDHSVPMVTVNMWYHVGSARERTGRPRAPRRRAPTP